MRSGFIQRFSAYARLGNYLRHLAVFAVILLTIFVAHYYTDSRTRRITTESNERIDVGTASNSLGRDLNAVIADLRFLSGYLGSGEIDLNRLKGIESAASLFFTCSMTNGFTSKYG